MAYSEEHIHRASKIIQKATEIINKKVNISKSKAMKMSLENNHKIELNEQTLE